MSLSIPTTSRPTPPKCRAASDPIRPAEPVMITTLTADASSDAGAVWSTVADLSAGSTAPHRYANVPLMRRLVVVSDTLQSGLGDVVRSHGAWFAGRGWSVALA